MMKLYKEKRNQFDDKLAILEATVTAAMYMIEEHDPNAKNVAYALYRSMEDLKESIHEIDQVQAC